MDDVDILLVEDNQGDVHLIERAFENRQIPGTVHSVNTGDEALDWLYRRGEFAELPRPDLVLLDLNLPGTGGLAVLEAIKSDADLQRIPVTVLTGSQSDDDLTAVYEEHANACLTKPVDPEEFADQIEAIAEFWLSTVALPPGSDPTDSPER